MENLKVSSDDFSHESFLFPLRVMAKVFSSTGEIKPISQGRSVPDCPAGRAYLSLESLETLMP